MDSGLLPVPYFECGIVVSYFLGSGCGSDGRFDSVLQSQIRKIKPTNPVRNQLLQPHLAKLAGH